MNSPLDNTEPTTIDSPAMAEDATLKAAWGVGVEIAVCERCDWSYLLPAGSPPWRCPHCFQAELTPWNGHAEDLPRTAPPELVLPFSVAASQVSMAIQNFAKNIPFPPEDLNPKNLNTRMQRVYLPMWLVDADAEGTWQAEAGFDYEVVSHQDHFDEYRGGWSSHQVNEGRIRWEPRLGRLKRRYQNIAAPALEENQRIQSALGKYDLSQAAPYQTQVIDGAVVRLPNRPAQDAWTDAKPAFQAAAAEECRQAASAQHMRQFTWQPEFKEQNWTLLLMPLFATYYKDDEGHPQPVLVNGQSGQINGVRRASMKSGQRAALGMLAAAMVIFLASLGISAVSLAMPPLLVVGVLGLVAALLFGLGAVYPVVSVWWFNRK
jgi:hypothetical protein